MGTSMEVSVIIAYTFGIMFLLLVGYLLIIPLKYLGKFLINIAIGVIGLIVKNFFGGFVGFSVGVNPITALIIGFLRIPGIILLVVLKYII